MDYDFKVWIYNDKEEARECWTIWAPDAWTAANRAQRMLTPWERLQYVEPQPEEPKQEWKVVSRTEWKTVPSRQF